MAPSPISEASTVMDNGCFVFGIKSSVSEERDVLSFRKEFRGRLSISMGYFRVKDCKMV